jgi:hypothetical protein
MEWERKKENGGKETKDMEGIKEWKKGMAFFIIFGGSCTSTSVCSTFL